MALNKKTIDKIDVKGKRVLMRLIDCQTSQSTNFDCGLTDVNVTDAMAKVSYPNSKVNRIFNPNRITKQP